MLDLKRLTYLEAVYRYRSFTKASEALFVTQPTISVAIRTLEEEAGVKLIEREPQGVYFTHEGEMFAQEAARILKECEKTEDLLSRFSENWQHKLNLGISPTLGIKLQKYLCSPSFSQRFSGAEIGIEEDSMSIQIEKIRKGVLDLAFNGLPEVGEYEDLELLPISTARIECVMRPNHPLANKGEITLEDLADTTISFLGKNSKVYLELTKAMAKAGISPKIHSFHEQILCMLNTVILGNFVGFICVSDTYIENEIRRLGLVLRSFKDPIYVPQGFLYAKGRQLPRIGRELIEIITELEKD